MPPPSDGNALSQSQIALLGKWIDEGAHGPPDEKPEPDPKDHWAFRTPVRPSVPAAKSSTQCTNAIDALLAAEWDKRRLTPQPPAPRRLLLRRVYLDLIGLPATLAEQDAFLADTAPDAYEKVVERLLASKHYGERWGRHWMDVWRYSDWWGLGAEVRNSQKHIWHWRDWIIESLNADKGYDQMLREMLAADELYPDDLDRLRATGYLVRPYFLFNRNTWLDEVLEHTAKGILGLTLNCAKCHDHKYDPIRQTDYYRLRAFFEPYQIRIDEVPGEVDIQRDGIPRVFDCNLAALTYRFIRGDEKRPLKDQPLTPGLPALLSNETLAIRPVSLPPLAHSPGLRPFVAADQITSAEKQVRAQQEKLVKARADIAEAQKRAGHFAAKTKQTMPPAAVPSAAKPAGSCEMPQPLTLEQARAAMDVAEKALALAQEQPCALSARAAAQQSCWSMPDSPRTKDLARQAVLAERRVALARAGLELAEAELELLHAKPETRVAAQTKRKKAHEALEQAQKTLETPGEAFTPLQGSWKTPESNVETEASRSKPFPTTSTGRRSALAKWLTDPRHPLTARVAVNHIWARHFGKPLVPTVFDFGRKGTPPTHPALLDFLAAKLIEHQWSLKQLHRLMVTSSAYRMSSSAAGAAANCAADPENRWYWRSEPIRMQAEVIRDSLLHLARQLDPTLGGPPIDPHAQEASRRRSLYIFHSHNERHKFLSMFDDANVLECYRRTESIVPQQALALSNSRLTLEMAKKINERLHEQLGPVSDKAFVRAAFEFVLCCTPSADESDACERALDEWTSLLKVRSIADPRRRARADLIAALVNHNDFITIR
jgi:hypothetical protein